MGKKGNKRKTRWRVLPIGGDDAECVYSTNEEDCDGEHGSASPTAGGPPGCPSSYARAAQPGRARPGAKTRLTGYQPAYYRPHRPYADKQPLVTTEKKTFNEEEYTKITTPRQDVLFKKGYLGRKRPAASGSAAGAAGAAGAADGPGGGANPAPAPVPPTAPYMVNGTDALPMHNGGDCELPLGDQAEMMSPTDEQAQYMYQNGYVDHGVIYVNGSYEWGYDPYGNVTAVVVGPAPHYAGPGGGAPVLAAVPCQPLPLQPLEWFNPAYGMPYMAAGPMAAAAAAAAAAAPPSCPRDRDRRKRSSTDSQNCSPQSSESTEPPGSPQEGDGEADPECECGADGDGELEMEAEGGMAAAVPGLANGVAEYAVYAHAAQAHGQPQPYVYPGTYMFGPPIYNMNGITVQGTAQPPHCIDNSGSKRRKKKRRRRRRRGGVEDGSEESSSDEKDLEEPVSLTSQESSQELESDSKHSAESVSCPKVVGCTELPVKTQNSPSLSPSPPPPPAPSPPTSHPPPNVSEDKTVLSKVNGNTIEDIISVRSEAENNNSELDKSTVTTDKLENHLDTVVNLHTEKALQNVNEVRVPNNIPSILQKTSSSPTCEVILVSSTNKIIGNHLVGSDKSFDADNNKLLKDSCPLQNTTLQKCVPVSEDSKIQHQIAHVKEKTKGRKGSKCSKPKQQTHQNGISEIHINENTSKGQSSLSKMDGNEASKCPLSSGKDKNVTTHAGSGQATGTATQPKYSETASGPPEESSQTVDFKLSSGPKTPPSSTNAAKKQIRAQKPIVTSKEEKSTSKEPQVATEDCKETTVKGQKSTSMDTANDLTKTIKNSGSSELGVTSAQCISRSQSSPKKKEESMSSGTASESKEGSQKTKPAKTNDTGKNRLLQEGHIQKECVPEAHSSFHLSKQMHRGGIRFTQVENKKSEISKSQSPSLTTGEHAVPSIKNPPLPFSEKDRQSPPIPPPRRKKWQPNRRRSSERPPTPGRELESKKVVEPLTDDSSSSSSHESEESVINLLSTIPSSNDQCAEIAQSLSEEEEEGIIFDKSKVEGASPGHRITIVPTDDLDTGEINSQTTQGDKNQTNAVSLSENPYTQKCISDYPQHISSGDQIQHKLHTQVVSNAYAAQHDMASTIPNKLHMSAVDRFADILIHELLDDALVIVAASVQKTKQIQPHHLSITEAVTQWLHSQDTVNVLPVPKINESESDDSDDVSEENMTGPKNVYRNPLLASSCEKNKCDDAGIRVATSNEIKLNKKKKLPKSNEYMQNNGGVFCENEMVRSELISCSSHQSKEVMLKRTSDFIKYNESSGTRSDTNEISKQQEYVDGKRDNIFTEYKHFTQSEKCNLSFTTESSEYDTDWECEPVLLKPTIQALTPVEDDQQGDITYLESPGNKCANMCNPTLSVAKYYRLGPPTQRRKNGPKHKAASEADMFFDCEEKLVEKEEEDHAIYNNEYNGSERDTEGRKEARGKESYYHCSSNENDSDIGCYEDEVDALIHFKKELNEANENSLPEVRSIPTSWSVDPLIIENKPYINSVSNTDYNHHCADLYKITYEDGVTSDSGIQSEESSNEDSNKIDNNVPKSFPQTASVLHHKSALLVSHLCTEGSFPCGGICCILQ